MEDLHNVEWFSENWTVKQALKIVAIAVVAAAAVKVYFSFI